MKLLFNLPMNIFIDFYTVVLAISLFANLYVGFKYVLLPYISLKEKPHVLVIYGASDFDRAEMVSNLFNSGLPYTFVESGLTRDYLVRLVEDPSIKIVELSAHGDSEGIVLGEEIFPFGWLKNLFYKTSIEVILLLSCNSHVYESLLEAHCAVVSLVGDVEDSVVLEYTKEFYTLVGKGSTFRDAALKAKRVLKGADNHKIQVRWSQS